MNLFLKIKYFRRKSTFSDAKPVIPPSSMPIETQRAGAKNPLGGSPTGRDHSGPADLPGPWGAGRQ